jgi:hypothetical protein
LKRFKSSLRQPQVAINLLLDRLPNLRMDPGGDDSYIRGQLFRSPTSLPVLFDAT